MKASVSRSLLGVVVVVMLAFGPGCKSKSDKIIACGEPCQEIHADGEKKCGKEDAECWAPIQAATNACFKACDEKYK